MEDIFVDLKNKSNDYSRKITENKYSQSIVKIKTNESHSSTNKDIKLRSNDTKSFNTLFELLLSIKDVNYNLLENKEKNIYISEQKLHLCTIVDADYDNLNFNKKILSKSLICANLQKKDKQ